MKMISWNVNGLRAVIGKGFMDILADLDPDILCLQEIKMLPEQLPEPFPAAYTAYWNPAQRKGYSGTAILSKHEPLSVQQGMGLPEHDDEGRVLTLEFEDYYVVTVYTPNSKSELLRLDYRAKEWDVAFLAFVKELEKTKPVIFCGDLNVAHKEIDLARPAANRRNPGFTDEEREGFENIVHAGFIDTFREFNQEPDQYSWWSYRANARANNVGWRIDYFCISPDLRPRLKDAFIRQDIMGSDHCPVGIVIE